MMIVSGLVAAFSRMLGGAATTTVGWAVVLLFGRIPEDRRTMLSLITFGSLLWVGCLLLIALPGVQGTVFQAVPNPGFLTFGLLVTLLVIGAVALPLAVGVATVLIVDESDRPTGWRLVARVLLGYPYAALLSGMVIFLAAVALVRKLRSLQRGWATDHLAVIIKAGRYDAVVDAILDALRDAGLEPRRQRAPRILEIAPRIVALLGGRGVAAMIPDELAEIRADDLGILVYPSDVALLGPGPELAKARSAIARKLVFSDAYLTTGKETETLEDHITELARGGAGRDRFRRIDEELDTLEIPYDSWETLLRLRLQAEQAASRGEV
jgi:hypothetical protein